MNFGNPQCVALGPLPDEARFQRLGPAIEHHELFPARTNVEFVAVDDAATIRILIWERGVGPTMSSGTGSCASLIAAAAYGGAARDAQVIAPGGAQRVSWREDSVYLTGWAEILFDGVWL
jgi:diaminopimelate epimerase